MFYAAADGHAIRCYTPGSVRSPKHLALRDRLTLNSHRDPSAYPWSTVRSTRISFASCSRSRRRAAASAELGRRRTMCASNSRPPVIGSIAGVGVHGIDTQAVAADNSGDIAHDAGVVVADEVDAHLPPVDGGELGVGFRSGVSLKIEQTSSFYRAETNAPDLSQGS